MHEQLSLRRISYLTWIALGSLVISVSYVNTAILDLFGISHFHGGFEVLCSLAVGAHLLVTSRLLSRFRDSVIRANVLQRETLAASIAATESESRLERYLELAPDAFLTLNSSDVILSANKRACKLFGYSNQELVGSSIEMLIAERNRDIYTSLKKPGADFTKFMSSGSELLFEGLRKDGGEFYIEVAFSTFEEGDELITACVARDVTASLELKKRIETSEQNLLAILENSAELLWSLDSEHRLVVFNRAFENEYATFSGQLPSVGTVMYSIFDECDQQEWKEAVVQALAGHDVSFHRHYNIGGSKKVIQTSLSPICKGERIVGVSCSATNITERKLAEEKLSKSLLRFEYVTRATNEVIWDWNLQVGKIYWGANYEKVFGYAQDQEELEAKTWETRVHPDDRQRVVCEVDAAIADSAKEYWESEYRYSKVNGEYVIIHDKAYIIRDKHGVATNMVGAMDDVTALRNSQQKLLHFNRELESKVIERTAQLHEALEKEKELNVLKNRFVSMVSHEFRTPLTVILSSSQLLERYYLRMQETQRSAHFHTIRTEVLSLVNILNDVLTLGKVNAGKINFNPKSHDIATFVEQQKIKIEAIDTCSHQLQIVNNWPHTQAMFDEALMSHVVANLLSNAIKYSDSGSTIYFTIKDCHGYLTFEVRDEGIGIPENELDRLFQPFHRASNVGAIQGTGLGLSIVQEYIQLHGGSITATSIENKGSTFTVKIPQTNNIGVEVS